jgi:hypothetical protein
VGFRRWWRDDLRHLPDIFHRPAADVAPLNRSPCVCKDAAAAHHAPTTAGDAHQRACACAEEGEALADLEARLDAEAASPRPTHERLDKLMHVKVRWLHQGV